MPCIRRSGQGKFSESPGFGDAPLVGGHKTLPHVPRVRYNPHRSPATPLQRGAGLFSSARLSRRARPCGRGPALRKARRIRAYYAARKNGYTVRRAAAFAGKALVLAQGTRQGLSPPRGPLREGRAAAPPRTLPADCAVLVEM